MVPADLRGVLALTKLAYFGGVANTLGLAAIGFPGASTGYAAASAAGIYLSGDPARPIVRGTDSTIAVTGPGAVRAARLAVFATTDDAVAATLRDHRARPADCELELVVEDGDAVLDDVALGLAGGPAAGTWRLEVTGQHGGAATLALWTLRLRTDLDGPA